MIIEGAGCDGVNGTTLLYPPENMLLVQLMTTNEKRNIAMIVKVANSDQYWNNDVGNHCCL